MSDADFIRQQYAAFGRGDVKAILDAVDPAIEWTSNGDGGRIPWGGRRSGVPGVASFFQALADHLDFEIFEPREFFESGGAVIVLGRTRARAKKGGGVFDCAWAHVFALKGGKLARFEEYYDTAAIEKALAA
jgi:uncharacterized protein